LLDCCLGVAFLTPPEAILDDSTGKVATRSALMREDTWICPNVPKAPDVISGYDEFILQIDPDAFPQCSNGEPPHASR